MVAGARPHTGVVCGLTPDAAWLRLGPARIEPRVGAMLPCNVIIREVEGGVEVSAVDPVASMQAIENAISQGQKGILITPNGPGVVDAIEKARDQGLFVIALDTPPDPADTVDITFATDNFKAGELVGKWTAAQLAGKPATIALLDLFNDKVVSVDYNRDQGFLEGMGIQDIGDPKINGDGGLRTGPRVALSGRVAVVSGSDNLLYAFDTAKPPKSD